jgi:LPXTG-motif cell wall-anchored protein
VESDNPDNYGDNNTASATVLVESDGGGLPATGSDAGRFLGIGGITLLLGGALVLFSRRRTTV